MRSELKPCPFCGGEAVLRHASFCGYDSQWVECTNRKKCGSKVEPVTDVPEVAIQAWNTRKWKTCRLELEEPKEDGVWWCSYCKSYHQHKSKYPWAYCPRCGAKVVE